ncbi:MAG: universal stress protein [Corynebacterium sp.]|nr:universal stress protein [Corynebacterium sp.]
MSSDHTMLIAYDGSATAHRAMEYAARYVRPCTLEILTAWEPLGIQAARALTGIKGWWNNSTAEYVVRHAGCPVFVVPDISEDLDDVDIDATAENDGEYF